MMETLTSTSGFTSDASLSGNFPHTPPYTPHRAKRRFERNYSPASARSIEPPETSSPAKKAAKRHSKDEVQVEELIEGDAGYITDIHVVYPHELEEVESDSELESASSVSDDSDVDITTRLSRLDCEESPEAEFEKKRREKHLRKRKNARVFKRSHSQSVKSDTETTDPDAMGDHDLSGSARRLRRRVRGPADTTMNLGDIPRSSVANGGLAEAAEIRERHHIGDLSEDASRAQAIMDTMDVDESS